ncbi:hypothetical protein H0H87_005382, partial [Tephrocybe sp. NHM501043]
MPNARSRLLLASVLGVTCATIAAVCIYTKSRPSRKEGSKSSSGSTVVPSVNQANGDVTPGTAEASADADSQLMPNVVPQAMSNAAPSATQAAPVATNTALAATAFQVVLAAATSVPPQAPPAAQLAPVVAPVALAVVAAPTSSPEEAARQLIAGQTIYSLRRSKREAGLQLVKIKISSSSIELDLKRLTIRDALEEYESHAAILDQSPEAAFQIMGSISDENINWSSTNLQKLAAGFQWLRDLDTQRQRCKTLTIELPTAGNIFPRDNPENTALFLPAVTNLTWTSHRNQLPLMFCPTQIPHPHLTSLTLNCDLSIPDCASVLREFAATLVKFKVARLIGPDDDPDNLSVLPQNGVVAPVNMLVLDTLDIDSESSPGSMLDEFHFENLK